MRLLRTAILALLSVAVLVLSARGDVPFVRGDTNADGSVDIVDAANILEFLFAGAAVPACREAWDCNDDSQVNIADVVNIFSLFKGQKDSLPPPFDAPGADPTPDDLGCADATARAPIEDSGMTMALTSCSIAGSTTPSATTTVVLSSDQGISALQFKIRVEGVDGARLSGVMSLGRKYDFIGVDSEYKAVACIPNLACDSDKLLGPGEGLPILDLLICLPEGTLAGSYRLSVEDARASVFSDTNAHVPVLEAADIEVLSPVTVADCPPPEASWEYFARYGIDAPEGHLELDESFSVGLTVKTSLPASSFDIALDFDAFDLTLVEVTKTLTVGAGTPPLTFDVITDTAATEATVDPTQGYVVMHIDLGPDARALWVTNRVYTVAQLRFAPQPSVDEGTRCVFSHRDVGPEGQYANRAVLMRSGVEQVRVPENEGRVTVQYGEDPPPIVPGDLNVSFRLSEASGRPGDSGIPIDFFIESDTPMQGFSMAFRYDAAVLRADSAECLALVEGRKPDFVDMKIQAPANQLEPHGVYLGVVADFMQEVYFVAHPQVAVARTLFTILESAPAGTESTLAFDGNHIGTPPVDNTIVVNGMSVPPELRGTELRVMQRVDGKVKVLAEVSIFLRGDANADTEVNVADAVFTLGYLFKNESAPLCPDAADANDDGRINVGDAIAILFTLFRSGAAIAAPYPDVGVDPTPADALGPCVY